MYGPAFIAVCSCCASGVAEQQQQQAVLEKPIDLFKAIFEDEDSSAEEESDADEPPDKAASNTLPTLHSAPNSNSIPQHPEHSALNAPQHLTALQPQLQQSHTEHEPVQAQKQTQQAAAQPVLQTQHQLAVSQHLSHLPLDPDGGGSQIAGAASLQAPAGLQQQGDHKLVSAHMLLRPGSDSDSDQARGKKKKHKREHDSKHKRHKSKHSKRHKDDKQKGALVTLATATGCHLCNQFPTVWCF